MELDPPRALRAEIEGGGAVAVGARQGRALRRLGWTHGEIHEVIDVPKGTLAGWCREIERIRAEAIEFARAHLHDPMFVAGTVMYWAAGAKTKQLLAVSNADPAALHLFIVWARTFHGAVATFVLSLHLHAGDDDAAARRWWADELCLDEPDFTRTFVKSAGTGHRHNHLPHGMPRADAAGDRCLPPHRGVDPRRGGRVSRRRESARLICSLAGR